MLDFRALKPDQRLLSCRLSSCMLGKLICFLGELGNVFLCLDNEASADRSRPFGSVLLSILTTAAIGKSAIFLTSKRKSLVYINTFWENPDFILHYDIGGILPRKRKMKGKCRRIFFLDLNRPVLKTSRFTGFKIISTKMLRAKAHSHNLVRRAKYPRKFADIYYRCPMPCPLPGR